MFCVSDIVQTVQSQRKMSAETQPSDADMRVIAALIDAIFYSMSEIKNPIHKFYFWNEADLTPLREITFMVL